MKFVWDSGFKTREKPQEHLEQEPSNIFSRPIYQLVSGSRLPPVTRLVYLPNRNSTLTNVCLLFVYLEFEFFSILSC
jgi:hypothetical protein